MTLKRPFLLYMLAVVFLFGSLISTLGLIETVKAWNWLRAFEVKPGPIYLIFKNSFLTLGWLAAAVSLWMRFTWAPLFGSAVSIFAALWFWVDRVILTQNPLPFTRHLLSMIVSILFLVLILLSSYLLTPFMKSNSQRLDDQSKPDSAIGEQNA